MTKQEQLLNLADTYLMLAQKIPCQSAWYLKLFRQCMKKYHALQTKTIELKLVG